MKIRITMDVMLHNFHQILQQLVLNNDHVAVNLHMECGKFFESKERILHWNSYCLFPHQIAHSTKPPS